MNGKKVKTKEKRVCRKLGNWPQKIQSILGKTRNKKFRKPRADFRTFDEVNKSGLAEFLKSGS